MKLLFGIHCHQPVGNFDHVLEESYQKSYLPFIKVLYDYPQFKFTAHYTGFLLEWIERNHPEFFGILNEMIERGQVEIMTGSFYEAIIAVIPDEDKLDQINWFSSYIKEKLKYEPSGMWMAERVWEPNMPKMLNLAGIKYITLDDSHFYSAGLLEEGTFGYYMTEENGYDVKVFPISEKLRYCIPFKLPEETINYLVSVKDTNPDAVLTIIDDGEKFGVWPGTHKWVYEERWLRNFIEAILSCDEWLTTQTFSECINNEDPLGNVYLPTASYMEMMEWSLPSDIANEYAALREEIKNRGELDKYKLFFKGGFWRNFLAKYPESNHLQKRVLKFSSNLREYEKNNNIRLDDIKKELFMSQANDAYWHGIFGGLYLPHLRHALYEHLIKGEKLLSKMENKDSYLNYFIEDFNKDGFEEVTIDSGFYKAVFSPSKGGTLIEYDLKNKNFNLLNTLSRHPESYHFKVLEASEAGKSDETKSIHDLVKVKENGLENYLFYDSYQRVSLVDHFLSSNATLDDFMRGINCEEIISLNKKYNFEIQRNSHINLIFHRENSHKKISVTKNISFYSDNTYHEIVYEIKNNSSRAAELWFGTEFNFSLLGGRTYDRYYIGGGINPEENYLSSKGESTGKEISLVNDWDRFKINLKSDRETIFWRCPVETVSQSEEGFERIYQSSTVLMNWKMKLNPNEKWVVRIIKEIVCW